MASALARKKFEEAKIRRERRGQKSGGRFARKPSSEAPQKVDENWSITLNVAIPKPPKPGSRKHDVYNAFLSGGIESALSLGKHLGVADVSVKSWSVAWNKIKRFEAYKSSPTVKDYIAKVGDAAKAKKEMAWDAAKGNISLKPKTNEPVKDPEFEAKHKRDEKGRFAPKFSGNVSEEFKKQVNAAVKDLPDWVKEEFSTLGTTLIGADFITNVMPELAREHPTGYPDGATWDMSTGLYDWGINTLVVSNKHYRGFNKTNLSEGRDPYHTTMHEAGHAVDYALSGFSSSEMFRSAWEADLAHIRTLPSYVQESLAYFTQRTTGFKEAFAETFAQIHAKHYNFSRQKLERDFQNVWKLMYEEIFTNKAKAYRGLRKWGRRI